MHRFIKFFILTILLICFAVVILHFAFAMSLFSSSSSTNTPSLESTGIDALYELENNNDFIIKERVFSLGKCYDIYAVKNNKETKIGEIRGKVIHAFGDIFTFYDLDGNIVAYEEEVYKLFKLTRSAEVYAANGTLIGYIGEEVSTNFLDPGFYFHYYDANQKEIGHSDQHSFSLFKTNSVYNAFGKKEYTISEQFNLLTDEYRITSVENPSVPKLYVMFSACIEDAIRDSQETESDNN